ncbi:LysR family transcriptional regulator [Pseudochelatococcus sp. B33]
MDELSTNRTFLKVVECGSFSAAARDLNVSVASIARQVSSLENRLGVMLLRRTTRQQSLTDAGRVYCECISPILRKFDDVKREVSSYQSSVKGRLTVHLRNSVGSQFIVPALPQFLEQHPEVTLDVTLTDERADLVAQGVDVAVWLGHLEDSGLVARRLSSGRRRVCCAPSYAQRFGLPAAPMDLARHNCLIYRAQHYDNIWRLTKDGETTAVRVSGNLETTSAAVLMSSALKGLGFVVLQEAMVRGAIDAGDLIDVFPDYLVSSTDIDIALYAVHPGRRQIPPKTRAFVDFLVRLFKGL